MVFTRAVVAGFALAALAAGPAQAAAPELSVSQRLDDRREVAAGTRAQVLGFEDGRFYAQGWHITGEMGGIVTPPLKLLDSVYVRDRRPVDRQGDEVHERAGYIRYDLPRTAGIGVERTDVAPDGRARRAARPRAAQPGQRGAHRAGPGRRALRADGPVPVGLRGVVPNASDNAPDTGAYAGGRLVFRDTGQLPGEAAPTLLHRDRRLRSRARDAAATGPGHYGPNGMGRTLRRRRRRRADAEASATTGRSARAPAAGSRYELKLPAGGSTTLWIAVAGSERLARRGALRAAPTDARPGRRAAEKQRTRRQLARWTQL